MENQTVIEVFLDEADKVVYGDWCDIRIKLCFDYIAVLHGKSNNWILCHCKFPFFYYNIIMITAQSGKKVSHTVILNDRLKLTLGVNGNRYCGYDCLSNFEELLISIIVAEMTESVKRVLQMIRKVVFLLKEYEGIDWELRLTELVSDLQKNKIAYAFCKVPDSHLEPDIIEDKNAEYAKTEYANAPNRGTEEIYESRDSAAGSKIKHIIYISDASAICRKLADRGCCVLPYRHDYNREEGFESSRYFYIAERLEEMDYESLDMAYRRLAGLPWEILRTKRCIIRETTVEDVDAFYQIYREPDITAYMEDLYADRNEEIAYVQDYIKKIYHFYGYGMWTVMAKDGGRVIGRAGISWREGFDLPELGFVIGVPWQRQGYAYEVCSAILAYARDELGMTRVQALVMRGNEKSGKLCGKLGFHKQQEVNLEREIYTVFEIDL